MQAKGLKPCPFCGGMAGVKQLKQSITARYFVVCFNGKDRCIASEHNVFGHFYVNRDDAVNAWNRRANDEPICSSEHDEAVSRITRRKMKDAQDT